MTRAFFAVAVILAMAVCANCSKGASDRHCRGERCRRRRFPGVCRGPGSDLGCPHRSGRRLNGRLDYGRLLVNRVPALDDAGVPEDGGTSDAGPVATTSSLPDGGSRTAQPGDSIPSGSTVGPGAQVVAPNVRGTVFSRSGRAARGVIRCGAWGLATSSRSLARSRNA
jgi:hypothetical protein